MAKSQNGWAAHTTSNQMVPLKWITGRVHPDTLTIFDHLCKRFNAEVEPINKAHSWGYNYRPIRGRVSLSNHASGTAIDLNAPAHPLGKEDTFDAAQRRAIRSILADFSGAITWGGDWTARPDDMHFEVANGVSPQTLKGVVAALAPKPTPGEVITPTPAPVPVQEDDIMAIYVKGDKADAVFAHDTISGKRRWVDGREYALLAATGTKVHNISQAVVDAIPETDESKKHRGVKV